MITFLLPLYSANTQYHNNKNVFSGVNSYINVFRRGLFQGTRVHDTLHLFFLPSALLNPPVSEGTFSSFGMKRVRPLSLSFKRLVNRIWWTKALRSRKQKCCEHWWASLLLPGWGNFSLKLTLCISTLTYCLSANYQRMTVLQFSGDDEIMLLNLSYSLCEYCLPICLYHKCHIKLVIFCCSAAVSPQCKDFRSINPQFCFCGRYKVYDEIISSYSDKRQVVLLEKHITS